MKQATSCRGFTLLELMVVIVILGIVSAIALPNMTGVIRSNRITTATNELNASFAYARTEAMRINASLMASPSTDVVLCAASADAEECGDSDDWSNGWVVAVRGPGEDGLETQVLRVSQAPGRVEVTNVDGEFVFDHRGRVSGPTGMTIQPVDGDCTSGRDLISNIVITPVGQFRSTRANCS